MGQKIFGKFQHTFFGLWYLLDFVLYFLVFGVVPPERADPQLDDYIMNSDLLILSEEIVATSTKQKTYKLKMCVVWKIKKK